MKQLAYALLVVALVVAPVVAADPEPEPEPGDETPCNWFEWSLDPPGAEPDIECLLEELPPN